jgi:Ca-activated chloride channel family protein
MSFHPIDPVKRVGCGVLLAAAVVTVPVFRSAAAQEPAHPSAPTAHEPAGPPRDPALPREAARVELVLVPVSVHDRDGKPVLGLEREDFVLYEEGERREIATFDRDSTPVAMTFSLDCSGSMYSLFPFVKATAIAFLQRLPPQFRIALFAFGESARRKADFSEKRDHLYYEIGRLKADGGETALFEATSAAIAALHGSGGRRVAILFTDGDDTLVEKENEPAVGVKLVQRARTEGVMIVYVVYGEPRQTPLLESIARDTGGALIGAGSGRTIASAFQDVARELTSQYTLGIAPSRAAGEAAWRSLRVEVDRPGLSVSARPGYFAAPSRP